MKTLLLAFLTAFTFGALVPASRAGQSGTSAAVPTTAGQLDTVRLGLVSRTTALIGTKVRDRGDSSHGRMEDVLVDLSTGQAVAALFSSGSDNQLTLVPARSFWTATGSKVLVSADKQTLKGAPCISKTDSSRALEPGGLSQSFKYFNQELPKMPAAGAGSFSSAARLVQQQLLSQSNQPLGQVADIVVDLPVGRLVYLLIQPAAGGEAQGVLYAVPPQSVRPDAMGQALVLKCDQTHFLAGPHFRKEFGTELSRPEFAAAVQQHYNLQAAATDAKDSTRQQVSARREAADVTAPTVPVRSDQEITRAVVSEIVRDNHAFSTHDLKITTSNGRVTLASHVKNEKQKQMLVAAAARVVGMANVDAQIETPSKR